MFEIKCVCRHWIAKSIYTRYRSTHAIFSTEYLFPSLSGKKWLSKRRLGAMRANKKSSRCRNESIFFDLTEIRSDGNSSWRVVSEIFVLLDTVGSFAGALSRNVCLNCKKWSGEKVSLSRGREGGIKALCPAGARRRRASRTFLLYWYPFTTTKLWERGSP